MAALRAFISIGLALTALLIVTGAMFSAQPIAYTGITPATHTAFSKNVILVAPHSPAYAAGLRTGDEVGCLSVRDAELLKPSFGFNAGMPGMTIHLCAKRGGATRNVSFSPALRPPIGLPYWTIPLTLVRLGIYVTFLFCGVALVLARPRLLTWLFFAYCLGTAPYYGMVMNGTTWQPTLYRLALVFDNITISASFVGLLLFALTVPGDGIPQGWRRTTFLVAAALAIPYIGYASIRSLLPFFNTPSTGSGVIAQIFSAAAVLVVIGRLFEARREERARLAWVAFALIWGAIVSYVKNMQFTAGTWQNVITSIAADLTIVVPIVIMYAILKRHIIDVRFVISRTLVYAVLTTVVVGIIGAIDWAMSAYMHEARVAMAAEAALTIGVGFLLHRAYRWMEFGVDFLLFRHKHEAEVYLQRLARTLPFAETNDAVNEALVHAPVARLHLTGAALFHRADGAFERITSAGWNANALSSLAADHDAVRFLKAEMRTLALSDLREHERHTALLEAGGSIAVPIFQSNVLFGFVLYGTHRDTTALDPDEIAVLERLCERAAEAYTAIELAALRVVSRANAPERSVAI